jgi:hypothetical protein
LSDIVKSLTVKEGADVLWDTFVFTPITVGVKVPTGVLPLVVKVMTEEVSGVEEVPLVQVALKLGVVPGGKLEALKQTVPMNPPARWMVTV